ncbi:AI-2E family transporter [Sphingomonas sabuli]|uniref:AI-2E family transporter n=1 Tax=Sphingomonas sabuli TaxID=2764186 RepID=A0A7G9L4F6_9SPHN|nr:AI-2E family transporter [Sphingomonas sabuli]QNM83505.1 AI-2E family transporter [Sphingomonas sabuli]
MARKPSGGSDTGDYVRKVLIALALGACVFLAWELRFVLVLLFGAVVVGAIIRAISGPACKYLHLPDPFAVLLAVVVLFGTVIGAAYLMGSTIISQMNLLNEAVPKAIGMVDQWFGTLGFDRPFQGWLDDLQKGGGSIMTYLGGWLSAFGNGLANFLLVVFGGIFLAAQPEFYRTGTIKLVPKARRSLVSEAMDESETALRLWLKGQLISMVLVGVLTAFGLWALGIESWLVLGLLAGLFEFVPFAGPILAAIPGIMLALAVSPELAFWTAMIYILVQHVEAYLIQPLVQQYAVELPPVVLLFSLLAFGLLFGAIGIFFAAPLAVVTYVLIKRLYVREALDTATPIPGEVEAKKQTASRK